MKLSAAIAAIQFYTGETLEDIAKKIGYSRPYLNKAKLLDKDNKKLMNVLESKYGEILQKVPNSLPKMPESNPNDVLNRVTKLETDVELLKKLLLEK